MGDQIEVITRLERVCQSPKQAPASIENPAQIAAAAVTSALWPVAVGVNKKSEERERKRKLGKMEKDKESQKKERKMPEGRQGDG